MFHRILVPVDLTPKNRRALSIALDMAGESGAEVLILHVIELVAGMQTPELKSLYRRLERRALEKITVLGRPFQRRRIRVRGVVLFGDRLKQIVRHATETGTDLIVLNSHAVNPLVSGQGWGTLSYKVGIVAPCPVLLVK